MKALHQLALVLSLTFLTSALVGCSKHVSGKYEGPMGMTMEFKSGGKVSMTAPGDPKAEEGTYTEDGNKVNVTVDKETVNFTRNDDGSLTGSKDGVNMTFKKKA